MLTNSEPLNGNWNGNLFKMNFNLQSIETDLQFKVI